MKMSHSCGSESGRPPLNLAPHIPAFLISLNATWGWHPCQEDPYSLIIVSWYAITVPSRDCLGMHAADMKRELFTTSKLPPVPHVGLATN